MSAFVAVVVVVADSVGSVDSFPRLAVEIGFGSS
jgi:hypothetical protein